MADASLDRVCSKYVYCSSEIVRLRRRIGEAQCSAILRPIAQIIEYYPRCIRLVWDAAGPHAILAIGVSILGAVVPAAQVWITKIVIDSVVSAVGDGDGAAVDWVGLLIPVAGVFGVWILGSICSAAANGLLEKVGYLVGNPQPVFDPKEGGSARYRLLRELGLLR